MVMKQPGERVVTIRKTSAWHADRGAFQKFAILCVVAIPVGLLADFATAQTDPQESSTAASPVSGKDQEQHVEQSDAQVRPFLRRHCLECHTGEKPKGDLRLDRLSTDVTDEWTRRHWLAVLKRIEAGEMPPESRPRPSRAEIRSLSVWIREHVLATETGRRAAQGRVVLRRLNRNEYENTLRDLLGIDVEVKQLLPPDTSADGFDNIGEALHVSSFLMERYLEAADVALDLAIANGPQPPLIKKRLHIEDERQVRNSTEHVFHKLDDASVMFSSSPWSAVTLRQFYPPDRGEYRFRIAGYGYQSSGKPVTFRVDAGPMLMGTKSHLVGWFDHPADKPSIVEFSDRLEARSTIRIQPYGLETAHAVKKVGADKWDGAGLAIQWIEVEGPLHSVWPPESHRRIFGDREQTPVPLPNQRNRVEVVSNNPVEDARAILHNFARRAFRRTVTENDVAPFVELVEEKLTEDYSFEQAVRVGLKGILVSPSFLFLREVPGKLDDFALASRLSYFLWSTMPDDELLTLAEQGQLAEPQTLRRQVERLLAHPKAAALTENFVDQWLGLRDIDFTIPDRRLYPEYDDMLKVAMVEEARLFFEELLKHDLSLMNFVASDFSMLNERLAQHYGIAGVEGREFRKVALLPGSRRGGVMTMAGVLKVTADGTSTSPIVRGAWVLDRILGTPPAPPPPGVSAIEPDIRGATTVREQLAKHREIASCASCHVHIDPPGFALENFDVIGGWRDYHRSLGRGDAVVIDGRRMPYRQGPLVDSADVLADGRRFEDIDEFKRLLLEDKQQVARNMTTKLVTYATGQAVDAVDRSEIDRIVDRIGEQDFGLRSLVHEIVQSPLFLDK
jgi:hypothetical protein